MKLLSLALATLALTTSALMGDTPPKKIVHAQTDLPRFSYPVQGTASALVRDGGPAFDAFAAKVRADLDTIFRDYQIEDHSMLRTLLGARASLEELAGDYPAALKTLDEIQSLQDKAVAKLLSGLTFRAMLGAAIETNATSGEAFTAALKRRYAAALQPLPWLAVQDRIKASHVGARIYSPSVALASVMHDLDPATKTSGSLDSDEAWGLVATRVDLTWTIPTGPTRAEVLEAYIAQNRTEEKDIWEAREVTLTADQKLTPVAVAIWDGGSDTDDFPGQVFEDPNPTASGTHGLAFDDQGDPSTSWLYPLPADAQAAYPEFRLLSQGYLDIEHGLDTPAAQALARKYTTLAPDELQGYFETRDTLGHFIHGTHCAGIALRGNPAGRLVVARFNDDLPDLKFPPTDAWVMKLGADFQKIGEFFRTRHVRVVNMSWGDQAAEFETWIGKTGGGSDPAARKANAARFFRLWKESVRSAIAGSPDVLFIAAAGNSDSNPGFEDDIPASFHLPNLISVGAVNKAGDETSFTSFGDSVVLDANGYEVDSTIPGGFRMRLSGTSMATPNVVNLAAKLFALDPSLTPEQVIRLMRAGATASPDGRLHLIDEQKSVELLKAGKI